MEYGMDGGMAGRPLPFVKMSGTGNDFIIIDHRKPLIEPEAQSAFARLVCRRKFSVGADGLILIEDSEVADFRWQFYNADGSLAEMCGNGARCAARYAYIHSIAPARMRFETLAGIIEATVSDINVSVKMTEPGRAILHRSLEVEDEKILVHSIDTGVPHAVVFVDDIESMDVCWLGSLIRHHPEFAPAGTNVNFVHREADGAFKVRTYERGVEDETMACGTGAAAAALVSAMLGEAESPVEIITSGGDRLTIVFDLQSGNQATNVFLKGPAHVIYKGELSAEALL
ncbi:diaminopimelate epimerase [Desulfolithobacter dissulfuricans]|uniref:Diaminopimelate epimerase n=1 Tax=Desulfolithobacter dissulfuricans TaxID=2795293 RepID=A0A915U3T3_9BACT|nr:diaminopimelate epimerase [Desulfolithobacter dissulfuricans]BCO10809.1 diaminopimelate epimerase [Desulfolithobacter dissulfuricans]